MIKAENAFPSENLSKMDSSRYCSEEQCTFIKKLTWKKVGKKTLYHSNGLKNSQNGSAPGSNVTTVHCIDSTAWQHQHPAMCFQVCLLHTRISFKLLEEAMMLT